MIYERKYEEYLTSGLSVSEQYLKASILKNQKSESKRQLEYSNNNIREIIEHTSQQFVLSFAAVIMLYMIGVKPEFLKE